jgi:hypothetical protein
MTKMISKIKALDWANHEETNDVMECLVSDDRLQLLEMMVDRMKSMEAGDSVMVNLVNALDEEDKNLLEDGYLNGDGIAKVEIVYTNETAFNNT